MPYLVMGAGALGPVFAGLLHHRGRRTEIEALNGAICRYGAAVGVATPYNDAISRLVRFLEHITTFEFHKAL